MRINNNKNIMLTISLLVSNRKDTIRLTMESIKPLLEQLECECIVVDTGGTDGSVDIAREYTSNIVPFTWCNDFSAARNAGLKGAKGKWFMFLDDDEWFEDVTPIIEFFKSGEYKKYNSAVYLQRNYSDKEGTRYVDVPVSRVVKMEKDTHFKGKIHELITPICAPVKKWPVYANHYGYVFESDEEARKHFDRNATLLKSEMEKDPDNLRNYLQLAQEYGSIFEYDNGIDICRKAIERFPKGIYSSYGNCIFYMYITYLFHDDNKREAMDEGWRLINENKIYELTKASISAILLSESETTPQSLERLVKLSYTYFECVDKLEADPSILLRQEMLSMTLERCVASKQQVAIGSLLSASQKEDVEALEYFVTRLNWDSKQKLINTLEELKQRCAYFADAIAKALSKLPVENAYIYFQRFLTAVAEKSPDLQFIFNECVEQCYIEKNFNPEIIQYGISCDLDFLEMFAILDQEDWEVWVYAARGKLATKDYIKLSQIVERSLNSKNHIQYTAFSLIVQKYMILQEDIDTDTDFLMDLEQFCDCCENYFKLTYQESMFRAENQLNLPRMCRFAMRMNSAFNARRDGRFKDCIIGLKEALSENPSMKDVVESALKLLEGEIAEDEKRISRERMRSEEFAVLAKQIKEKVRRLILDGSKQEALQVISQLNMLLPQDPEVSELKNQADALLDM